MVNCEDCIYVKTYWEPKGFRLFTRKRICKFDSLHNDIRQYEKFNCPWGRYENRKIQMKLVNGMEQIKTDVLQLSEKDNNTQKGGE